MQTLRSHAIHEKQMNGIIMQCKPKSTNTVTKQEERACSKRCRISPSIVMVGLYNIRENTFSSICSGFIVDATRGLVVTGANTQTSNGLCYDEQFRLVVGCNNQSAAVGFSHIYAAEIMGEGRKITQPCVLRLTHVFRSSGKAKEMVATSDETTLGSSLPPHLIPVTPKDLHSNYELGISETLDLYGKLRVVGYDEHSQRPVCIAEGFVDPNRLSSPNCVVLGAFHQYHITDQMLGGPCISEDDRVIGLAVQMINNRGLYLIVTAPCLEAIIEKEQMMCDAAQYD